MRLLWFGLFESEEKTEARTAKETEIAVLLSLNGHAIRDLKAFITRLHVFESQAQTLLPPEGKPHDCE